MTRSFFIRPDYVENPGPVYFHDDVTRERGIVFQPDVYALAEYLTRESYQWQEFRRATVVDIGCGQGDKLAAMRERNPKWNFIGIDYGANIEYCRERFPWGTWLDYDLEKPFDLIGEESLAVVICSDVIEHLVDPTVLLTSIRDNCDLLPIVFSTPERDVQHGYDHTGPSPNLCHVREWNAVEFHELLTDAGFDVEFLGLTRGSDQGWAMATQIAICTSIA